MSDTAPRIGLVLGGGGMAGYAFHCGVLAALEQETGFDPRTAAIIVGTSAGAISGGILRGNVSATGARDGLLETVQDPERRETLQFVSGRSQNTIPRVWAGPGAPRMAIRELRRGRSLRMSKLVAALLPQGRQTLTPVLEPLGLLHGSRWPTEPLWIPATNLANGRLTVFGRDETQASVPEAVQASAALPVLFAPVRIDGHSYIDGGIGSPFNADLLIDYLTPEGPLDLVIVLAPLSIDELRTGAPFSSIARSLPRRRLRRELRSIAAGGTETQVVQPGRAVAGAMGLNPMAHRRIPAIIARSEELVQRQLSSFSPAVLDTLQRAAELMISPPDIPYPTVAQ